MVRLGLVERTEVPPSSLFVLVRDHVAAVPVLALARSHDRAIEMMCDRVVAMEVQPVAVWLFGSFARREADVESDIDAVFVRPGALTADDEQWSDAVEVWRHEVRRRTGNRVEVIEATASEIAEAVGTNTPLWSDIRRDCIVVAGPDIAEVAGLVDA